MNKNELRTNIDACRASHDDLRLPEMRELADCVEQDPQVLSWMKRSQQFDSAVAEVLEDVCVPDDLCDRLIEKTQRSVAKESPTNDAAMTDEVDVLDRNVISGSTTHRRTRRYLGLLVGTGAFTAAATLLFVFLFSRSSVPIDQMELTAEVDHWTATLDDNEVLWVPSSRGWDDRPLGGFVKVNLVYACRFDTSFDPNAAIYELQRDNAQAYLFVLRPKRECTLPAVPTKIAVSRGWTVAVWSTGDFLYVVATKNGRLQDFVRTPGFV